MQDYLSSPKEYTFKEAYDHDMNEIEDLKQKLMIAKNDKQIVYVKTDEDA